MRMSKPTDHPLHGGIMNVAAAIQLAEKSADSGIVSTAELIIATIRVQEDQGLPPGIAEPALAQLRRAIDAHMESRRAIVEAHAEYGRITRRFGATPESFGPTWPCQQAKAPPAPVTTLAAAA
jgi:hypothetical protein